MGKNNKFLGVKMFNFIKSWYLKFVIAGMYRDLDKITVRTPRKICHREQILKDIAQMEHDEWYLSNKRYRKLS